MSSMLPTASMVTASARRRETNFANRAENVTTAIKQAVASSALHLSHPPSHITLSV